MEKIKQFIKSEKGKDILIVIIVILVGLGSFELGRLSKEDRSSGIKIEYVKQDNNEQKANDPIIFNTKKVAVKTFFASNKGSKYYSIGCSGGKPSNKRTEFIFQQKKKQKGQGMSFLARVINIHYTNIMSHNICLEHIKHYLLICLPHFTLLNRSLIQSSACLSQLIISIQVR